MKFYQIIEHNDAATGDAFFATKKEAEDHIKKQYNSPEEAEINVLEFKGKLTKRAVCKLLTDWPQR